MLWTSKNKNDSIIRKFSIYLVASILVISAIAYLISYKVALNNARIELQAKSEQHLQELNEILKKPLWDFDNRDVQSIGNIFLANEFIDSLRIENNNHEIIFNKGNIPRDAILTLNETIEYNNTPVGYVYFAVSEKHIGDLKKNFLWAYFVNIVSIMLGTLLVTVVFLSIKGSEPF